VIITALIMGGAAIITFIITCGIVIYARNEREERREAIILQHAHEIEMQQLRHSQLKGAG